MKIAVIGAGPAGLTAAYKLSAEIGGAVSELDVYESSNSVGGMSRSIRLWDQTVDLGPHRFFSKDRKINELWLEVAGNNYDLVNRKTRIYYNKAFFDYPIQAFNALKGLGIWEAGLCVLSYIEQKIFPVKDTSSFEGWVTRRFGKRLYRIFFKTYSEKLWGIKCTELDSDFAAQRIKKLSLFEAIKNALVTSRKTKHATLLEQFAYPLKGSGSIYEKMRERILEAGGSIYFETPVKQVLPGKNKLKITLENGKLAEYDHVVSTMPLSLLAQGMGKLPLEVLNSASSLKFRNTILVYLNVDSHDLFPDQWLYIHDNEVQTGRITNFRNWVPQLYAEQKSSILCMEYWCNFEDPLWNKDDKYLKNMAVEEIKHIGLCGDNEILDSFVFRIPRCYPVYFSGYMKKIKPIQDFLNTKKNLHVIGRYGAYKYNNQDHSILMGILAAENILENKNHDLWQINTDYEVYQESASITKSGLSTVPGN